MVKRPKKKKNNMKPGTDPHAGRKHAPVAAPAKSPARQTAMQRPAQPVQSLAQKRAKDAWTKIAAAQVENDYGNYVAYVKSLPATIIMSGLGQALAMLKAGASKNNDDVKNGSRILYQHMNDWLCSKWTGNGNPSDILEAITEGHETDYIKAQAEAMEYLEWLKKFAVAFLKSPDEGD